MTIRHGSGTTLTHWAVEVANLVVLATGIQRIAEMRVTADRSGIAFNWRTLPDGQPQSLLKMRVLLRDLRAVGSVEPLLVSVQSTLMGDLLTALLRQYDGLAAIDRERVATHPPLLLPPFSACSIPLGPGTAVARGTTQPQAIGPIAAHVRTPWIGPSSWPTITSNRGYHCLNRCLLPPMHGQEQHRHRWPSARRGRATRANQMQPRTSQWLRDEG